MDRFEIQTFLADDIFLTIFGWRLIMEQKKKCNRSILFDL